MMDVRANASAVLPVLMSFQFCSYRSLAFDKELIQAKAVWILSVVSSTAVPHFNSNEHRRVRQQ